MSATWSCCTISRKATVQAANKTTGKSTGCFLILCIWQPLQQPLRRFKGFFCQWCWQVEPLIFQDENMTFSADVNALQGHEKLKLWKHNYNSMHLITYLISLRFTDLAAPHGHSKSGAPSPECRWLLLRNNARSTWPLTLYTVEPLYNGHLWGPTFCPL